MDTAVVVILFCGVVKVSTGDPCTSYSSLPDLSRRQVSNVLDYGQTALCDRLLGENWYKADRSDMPTTAPSLWTCGTDNPIWLADPLPSNDGLEHDLKACIKGFFSSCYIFITIKVKNCGKFNVYYLKAPRSCNQAYCFNTRKAADAPDKTVSNAVVKYNSLRWKKAGRIYIPYLTYKCTYEGFKDKKYCYKVNWYINGVIVFENQVVKTEFAEIRDDQFTNSTVYKMDSSIQCYVAVKFCDKDAIGEYTVSKDFFIGIKITTPKITIQRQGKGIVKFKTTVPYACVSIEGQEGRTCKTYIQMTNPSEKECGEKITGSNHCARKIEGYDSSKLQKYYNKGTWREEYTMEVVHQGPTNYISPSSRFRIRLESAGGSPEMALWEKRVELPDIIVDVYEETQSSIWKDKQCYSSGDPHMKNFDGRPFELQMSGVYIMYTNQETKQEVQIKTAVCSGNSIYCTCGVAARAGKDVFIIDLCRRPKFANFISCGDGALNVYKVTENQFKVIFPSGTTMTVNTWARSKYMNVYIYPFLNDVKKTKGLCGNLDGSNDQIDMQLRNNPMKFDTKTHPTKFSGSWQPTAADNLFSYKTKTYDALESLSFSQIKLCICDLNSKSKQANKQGKETSSTITCRFEKYAECNVNTKKMKCFVRISAKRRRRDLRNQIQRFKRQSSDSDGSSLPQTLTEREARLQCETAMNKSTMYTTCIDKVFDSDQTFLQDCTLDLQYTGQPDYINIALESALDSCKTITGKNITLQKKSPEIAEEIIASICPKNCSGNGDCYNGTCTCKENYGGLDCSFDKYAAPIVDSLSDDGKCDKSEGACDVVTFYGENFLEDTPTKCNIQRVEIDTSGNNSSNDSFTADGEQISLFEANCPLETVPNSFAAIFKVSISNDGSFFTTQYDVHFYDSMCQKYNASRETYILKDGFCFIEGQCYKNGQVNPNQKCFNCNINDKGKFNWSLMSDFCLIGQQCFREGELNPNNTCDICNIDGKGALEWSENKNVCNIAGVCFKNGEVNPANKCQLCNITDSGKDKWSTDNSVCIIDGQCYQNGDIKKDNICYTCDTKRSKTTWNIRDGFCYIDGMCLVDGQNNPMKPCLVCDASDKKRQSWSHDNGFCFINDTCYIDDEVDPGDICRICYVSSTEFKTDWSLSTACDNSNKNDEVDTTTENEIKATTETMNLSTIIQSTLQSTTISRTALLSTTTYTTTTQEPTTVAPTSSTPKTTPTTEASTSTTVMNTSSESLTTPTTEASTSETTITTTIMTTEASISTTYTTTPTTKAYSSTTTSTPTTKPSTSTSTTTPTTKPSTSTTSTTTLTTKPSTSTSTTTPTTKPSTSTSTTTPTTKPSTSTTSTTTQTTYRSHNESAPVPEKAESVTSTTIIVVVSIVVFCLVITAIVVLLIKRRRDTTRAITLTKLEMFDDGKIETVYNPMFDMDKAGIVSDENKDTEIPKNETTVEVLISGATANLSGNETLNQNEPDNSVDENISSSATVND